MGADSPVAWQDPKTFGEAEGSIRLMGKDKPIIMGKGTKSRFGSGGLSITLNAEHFHADIFIYRKWQTSLRPLSCSLLDPFSSLSILP